MRVCDKDSYESLLLGSIVDSQISLPPSPAAKKPLARLLAGGATESAIYSETRWRDSVTQLRTVVAQIESYVVA